MGDESNVNIDALAAFGVKDIPQVLNDYASETAVAMSKVGAAVPGLSGTSEGQTFSDWHVAALEAMRSFMQDSIAGFRSLSCGAIVEAANYRTGDLSQAQALQGVLDAFNPPAGSAQSVAAETAQSEFAQSREEYFHPTSAEAHLPPPDPQADLPGAPQSPQEQVREHNEKYGEGERWRPVDPNKAPEPSYGADQPMMGP